MSLTIVIFGASGDLTSRKLVPALYGLFRKDRLPPGTRVVGAARRPWDDAQWRSELATTTAQFAEDFDDPSWRNFARMIHYQPLDIGQTADFRRLADRLQQLEPAGTAHTRVYYLSTSPQLYPQAVAQLGECGLADEGAGPRRIVIEKPFGIDLASARQLNQDVHRVFAEHQVYRIDHYLGKETVQNLLVLRFANTIFEPVWNRNYVDHVQITVAEEVDVGSRGDYYDIAGVLRDMFQNHILQLMTITAMEAPVRYEANLVRDEKVKVLRAVRRVTPNEIGQQTVRGQYQGYRDARGVTPNSQTATFAAIKLWIDNWRWQGVPFYLRSGKAMSCRTTQIVVQFRSPPHMLFEANGTKRLDANRLVVQIQPAEGIQLHFQTKVPDAGMQLRMTDLNVDFRRAFAGKAPDAYQRLLLDAATGDASLFARSDEVELAWSIIDPILEAWRGPAPPLHIYPPGEWGPAASATWMADEHREWFDVCPILH